MTHAVETQLSQVWPPEEWRDVVVLMAVSGGADSVALLRAMTAVRRGDRRRLVVAHFNHQLRAGSDEDAASVERLCRTLDVPCYVGQPRKQATLGGHSSSEDAARDARYEFLLATARRLGARYVVTAHTADDQAETVLHRIIRGTGIAGLGGIPRTRTLSEQITLIRPLLHVRRADCLSYLAELGQDYRDDPSNADPQFTRNRIRHELLPLLEDYNSDVREALIRLGSLATDANEVILDLAKSLLAEAIMRCDDNVLEISCRDLASARPFLVREVLRLGWAQMGWPLQDMSHDKWRELAGLALDPRTTTAERCFPGGVIAIRDQRALRITRSTADSG